MSVLQAGRRAAGATGRLATRRSGLGGAVVLCYHDVVGAGATHQQATGLDVTVTALRAQVRLVRRLGFRFVALTELSARLRAGQPVDGLVAVTFDDALGGVARHALPVLAEERVPSSLMVVSTAWGRRPAWWPQAASRTMTRAELVEAMTLDVEIAAHTRTHPSLARLSGARLRDEVAGSKADLEDLTGTPVTQFAYPFGHHGPVVRDEVADAGYDAAYTFLNGRATVGDDLHRLPRLTMGAHHSTARLAYHLARPSTSWPDHQLEEVAG